MLKLFCRRSDEQGLPGRTLRNMDIAETIVAAVAAGAAAGLNDTASQTLKDAYGALKTYVVSKSPALAMVDANPRDEQIRQTAVDEVRAMPVVDEPLLVKALAIIHLLEEEPEARLQAWGIDISELHAAGSVVLTNLRAESGGITIRDVYATGGNVDIGLRNSEEKKSS